MTWDHQAKTMIHAMRFGASRQRAVEIANRDVIECPIPKRVWGFLWRPRRHRYEDRTISIFSQAVGYSHTLETLHRCEDCGHLSYWAGV